MIESKYIPEISKLEDYNEKISMNYKYAEVIGCSREIMDQINKQLLSRKE